MTSISRFNGMRLLIALALGLSMTLGFVQPGHADNLCVNPGGTDGCYATIQEAVDAASDGDTINVAAGTYVVDSQINLNKANLTLSGAGSASTIIQVSGAGDRFNISASGVTLQNFEIEKTDKTGEQNIIHLSNGNDVTIKNNTIHGQFVFGDGEVSRAIVINAGAFSGINIEGNTIYALRQPAYISGTHTGDVKNNYVYGTKGWVVEGGNLTFTGNTWGTGANSNVYDIAILALMGPSYYTDIVAMSAANNGAFIEDQRSSPATLSIVYVDGSVATSGDGTARSPKKTIAEGITRVVTGGTVNVAAGTYTEQVNTTKSLHLIGAGAGASIIAAPANLPAAANATSSIVLISGSGVGVELTGFTVTGPGPSSSGSIRAGIYVYEGANANIHHNTIQDIRDNPFGGAQNGVAILVGRQAWTTTGTATIDHNTIIGYQKGGIVVDNTGSSATITNNTVTGAGNTNVIAQNGIQISRGATATLTGNTIVGNSYHLTGNSSDWGSAGILLYQAGAVTLAGGNNISGNDQNLYIDSATDVTVGAEMIGPSTAPVNTGYDVTNLTTLNLNLTSVTFAGGISNFEIEDLIWHGADDATVGLATWVAGNLYVTPLSGAGAIQRAINAATAGDTINIAAGTYIENAIVNKSVTLAGAGAGTIVQPAVSNPNCGGAGGGSICAGGSNVFLVQANNVIIHDLTVDGDNPALTSTNNVGGANLDARNGIITNHNLGVYNGLEVYNVTVKNIYLRGVYASSGGTFNFHNNTVNNVQAENASIAMFAWGGPGTMANNTVSYANDAISANHSKGIQFLNNTVTHSASGVHTDNAGDGGGVADLIQGNNVDCTGKPDAYGVWVFVPYIAPTFNNNTVTNCDVGLSAWGQGAAVITQFTNNIVTGPAKKVGSVGAYITTDQIGYSYNDVSVLLTGNIITNFETGIYLTADAQSWTPGWVSKTINGTFHLNQINGNTNGVDKGTTGTYAADFAKNWWGASNGPSGAGSGTGDTIVAGLGFAPWCTNAVCTTFSSSFPPPQLPSSFYGVITIPGSAGKTVEAYIDGVTGPAALVAIQGTSSLTYQFDIPGDLAGTPAKDGGEDGDLITFKINNVVVGTGVWHSGDVVELNFAAVTLGGLSQTYNGTQKSVSVTTDPTGLAVHVTYDGSTTAPTNAGSYAVVATITTPNYAGSATGTLVIGKASATITLANLTQTYDGTAKHATYTTNPIGMTAVVTYNGSSTLPIAAGSYAVIATINNPNYAGVANDTLVISVGTASITLGGLTHTYDGTAKPATATTAPSGLTVTFTYNGSPTAPTAAGSYAVIATIVDANYSGTSIGTLVIGKATATVTLANLSQTYDGTAKHASATTAPANLTVTFTYDGSATAPTNAGSYAVAATVVDANYVGTASDTLVIGKATATVTLANLSQTYDGTAKNATVTTVPANLTVTFTYNGLAPEPVNAGSYAVVATVVDANYVGTTSGTLVIGQAAATITLSNLTQIYDGSPKSATATTSPVGLTVVTTYNGSTTAPIAAGSYAVVATINEPNYTGTASGTLVILSMHSISLVPGWNLVSFNVHPTNTAVATVLSSLAGNYDLVYAWNAGATNNNWMKYAPGAPGYSNSLINLDETMGFWIHMTAADTLDVTGTAPVTTSINLSTAAGGWNLVAYPSVVNRSLPATLSGTDFSLVYAYHANDVSDPWKLFSTTTPAWANDLTEAAPGWGYWVKVNADHTWSVKYLAD